MGADKYCTIKHICNYVCPKAYSFTCIFTMLMRIFLESDMVLLLKGFSLLVRNFQLLNTGEDANQVVIVLVVLIMLMVWLPGGNCITHIMWVSFNLNESNI